LSLSHRKARYRAAAIRSKTNLIHFSCSHELGLTRGEVGCPASLMSAMRRLPSPQEWIDSELFASQSGRCDGSRMAKKRTPRTAQEETEFVKAEGQRRRDQIAADDKAIDERVKESIRIHGP